MNNGIVLYGVANRYYNMMGEFKVFKVGELSYYQDNLNNDSFLNKSGSYIVTLDKDKKTIKQERRFSSGEVESLGEKEYTEKIAEAVMKDVRDGYLIISGRLE